MNASLKDKKMNPTGHSRPVSSNQKGIHSRLPRVLQKHLDYPWRQPLHTASSRVFDHLLNLLSGHEQKQLIIDTGCGTGYSSRQLAKAYPDNVIIGIDQSSARLARGGVNEDLFRQENLILMRAELSTFWRRALQQGWVLKQHYLLYPNPWPKAAQLKRRWHGHPVFPDLLNLGGELILRTNWLIYAEEFAQAVTQARGLQPSIERISVTDPLTPFERKFAASGHPLYELRVTLQSN